MKKKVLLIAAIVIVVSLIAAAGTYAYFVDDIEVHNVITSYGVNIELKEWQEGENGTLVPYPTDPIEGGMPCDKISKIVTIENNAAPAFVRAKYEIVVLNEAGEVMDIPAADIARAVLIASNGTDWQAKDPADGWMYYKESVATGGVTEPLFTEVTFSGEDMGNEYQNCTIQVTVSAQAVQSDNNGTSALEAAGWPNA